MPPDQLADRNGLRNPATAQNATNTPIFANPSSGNLNINSTTFGVITSATGARLIVLQGRLTF